MPLAHRILLAIDAGDMVAADSLIEEGRNLTEVGAIWDLHDYGHTVAQGFYEVDRSERMLRIFSEIAPVGPYDAILAGEMLNVMRQAGRYADADRELEVVLVRTPPEDLDGPALADVVLGIEPSAPLSKEVLLTTLARLDKWNPRISPDRQAEAEIVPALRLYYTGIINARLGEFDLAERQAALIEATAPQVTLSQLAHAMGRGVRAAVAYYRGDMEEVVRVTEDMQPKFPAAYWNRLYQLTEARTFQAEALFAVGRYRDALTWYEWGPPADAIDQIGLRAFRRGQIYDRLGDREKALEQYRNFLKAWDKADPQWQFRLDEARTRIEALGGGLVAQ
jgi:tetratricopeptide (TPR) repeat protein